MRTAVLFAFLLITAMHADKIRMTSMGCPSMEPFEKMPPEVLEDDIKLSQYAIANGCRALLPTDKIEAIGYDPRNDKMRFIQVIHKESGETLYVRRKNILVEQPGRKNEFRF